MAVQQTWEIVGVALCLFQGVWGQTCQLPAGLRNRAMTSTTVGKVRMHDSSVVFEEGLRDCSAPLCNSFRSSLTFNCQEKQGDVYFFRSQGISDGPRTVFLYMCWYIDQQLPNQTWVYYQSPSAKSGFYNSFVFPRYSSIAVSFGDVCDLSSPLPISQRSLLQDTGFRWKSSGDLADGSTIPACFRQDVVLPWEYTHSADEHILNVEWRFVHSGSTAEQTLATEVYGHFFKDESVARHIEFVPSAGLLLRSVTAEDMGTYSVHVHVNQNGASHTYVQSVNLVVTDESMAVGGVLEAKYQGAMYVNSTQDHHLILTCGTFTGLWQPKVNVVWMTPDNQTVPSTYQDPGHFALAVPNPFRGGQYTCKVDNSSPASVCIPSDSPLLRGATVTVDPVEGRLSLLASRMASVKAELASVNSQSAAMTGQAQSLLANNTDLASQIQALENQKNRLENDLLSRFPNASV